jgi:hypothetical protein
MLGKVKKVMTIYQAVVKAVDTLGQQFRNVHHYEFPGYDPTAGELQEFVDGLAAHYDTYVRPEVANRVEFYGVDMRRVDVGDLPTIELVPATWPLAGGDPASKLPNQVSAMVQWKAPTAYPRSCRTYCFPFTEDANSVGGVIEPGVIINLTNFVTVMEVVAITGQTDANKVAVQYGGDPRVVTASNPVSASPVTNNWATQRRRRIGVGI